jgi:predicted Fe-Mo cluster-binding NifX family protein
MAICFAIEEDRGVDSKVHHCFHSTLMFLIYDTVTGACNTFNNEGLDHSHGACDPLKAVGGRPVDAVVVGGIGSRALSRLSGNGTKVYTSVARTVNENLLLMKQGKLPLIASQNACCGFGPPRGCGHHAGATCNSEGNSKLVDYPR